MIEAKGVIVEGDREKVSSQQSSEGENMPWQTSRLEEVQVGSWQVW